MKPAGRFSRADRLLDSRDFRRVSRRGRRTASRYFVLLRAPTGPTGEGTGSRLGITVSRKVGNAVVRNYIKRNVREWFRASRDLLDPGDLVVIARRDAARLRGPEVSSALAELTSRAAEHGSGHSS